MKTFTVSTPATPAYIEVVLERLSQHRYERQFGQQWRNPPLSRDEARAVLQNLSFHCDDPDARVLFGGLYECLK